LIFYEPLVMSCAFLRFGQCIRETLGVIPERCRNGL
jgi:hypothetical protein